jgi:hypothetical protein
MGVPRPHAIATDDCQHKIHPITMMVQKTVGIRDITEVVVVSTTISCTCIVSHGTSSSVERRRYIFGTALLTFLTTSQEN